MSPLPRGGEVAVSAAGEGGDCLSDSYSNGSVMLKRKPSPGPERRPLPHAGEVIFPAKWSYPITMLPMPIENSAGRSELPPPVESERAMRGLPHR